MARYRKKFSNYDVFHGIKKATRKYMQEILARNDVISENSFNYNTAEKIVIDNRNGSLKLTKKNQKIG